MNVLSPLRDVSNNGEYATPSPSAKGGKKSRMFGVSKDENASNPKASTRMKPSLGKTPAASASSMKTPALATSTTRATPMSTTQKENAKAAKRTLASHAKANAPLKLNDDALKTPNGVGRHIAAAHLLFISRSFILFYYYLRSKVLYIRNVIRNSIMI